MAPITKRKVCVQVATGSFQIGSLFGDGNHPINKLLRAQEMGVSPPDLLAKKILVAEFTERPTVVVDNKPVFLVSFRQPGKSTGSESKKFQGGLLSPDPAFFFERGIPVPEKIKA